MRKLILETSEHLLQSEGLQALSMREVARRAGVTHQAPYHHFPDRESIIAELVTQGFEDLTRRLAKARQPRDPSDRRATLEASAEAYVGFAIDRPGLFRIMFRPEQCDLSRFPRAIQAGEAAHQELHEMVRMLHGEKNAGNLALAYWAQVHGMACLIVDGPLNLQEASARQKRAFARQALEPFGMAMLALPR